MSADSEPRIDTTPARARPGAPAGATIWLDGDVLACACPECSAPMSVRLWLLLADCWRCGASVELTEEQEREAMRLLKQREASLPPQPAPVQLAPPPPPPKPPPAIQPPARAPTRRPAASPGNRMQSQLRARDEVGEVDLFWRAVFRDVYAWLASFIVHLVLLIVLGISIVKGQDAKPTLEIVLSTRAGDVRREGGRKSVQQPDPIEFEKPAKEPEPKDGPDEKPERPEVEEKPEEGPDPGVKRGKEPQRPPRPAGSGTAAAVNAGLIAGRSSNSRSQLVLQEGGTTATEAAVARGLRWIAQHQNDDGSWSLDQFGKAGECKGRCHHAGQRSDTAGTALALLPFLGAGQTHRNGQYRNQIDAGLRWLVALQHANGDLPSPYNNTHMYAHGLGAIALCEAYALSQDRWLRDPAKGAIDFIVAAQHSAGGWRYQPQTPGDTSVVGWQLMALRSAQMANLDVPADVLERAAKYLDDAQTDSLGGRYAYTPGNRHNEVMTAEGLLCRQYAGWPHDHPGLVNGVEYVLDKAPKPRGNLNMYFVYYATQVMHHMGGEAWEDWNYRVRDILVDQQETKGHAAGSWTPRVSHDQAGGRLYQTALAVCTLEVYYRHLPLYRQSAVEK